MTRSTLISAVALLLLALLGLWWHRTFELRDVQQRLPLQGEARRNPLFGLQQVLRAQGHAVDSQAQLRPQALPEPTSTLMVLDADLRAVSGDASRALLAWVHDGGHALIGLPPESDGRLPELLQQLGLHLHEAPSCIDWKYQPPPAAQKRIKQSRSTLQTPPGLEQLLDPFSAAAESGRFCTPLRLHPDRDRVDDGVDSRLLWSWGNEENGYVMARLRHGDGQLLVSAQLTFLRTAALREPANAALTWQLLGPSLASGREVMLVYAADLPPLHVLLVHHGWPILLPLLLALLAWLWLRSQRFGPLLDSPETPRRALGEHLRAAAELALRHRQGSALLGPLRRRLLQRLALREPGLTALPARELCLALARRYPLTLQAIETALFEPHLRRPAALAEAVRTLHRLSQDP